MHFEFVEQTLMVSPSPFHVFFRLSWQTPALPSFYEASDLVKLIQMSKDVAMFLDPVEDNHGTARKLVAQGCFS